MRRHRTGQMSLNRHQQAPGAGRSTEFRAGNPFHGPDERGKPRHFAGSGAPLLRLLDHRLYSPQIRCRYQPARRKLVPNVLEKSPDKCDLLHKLSERSALNPWDEQESIPTFIPAVGRHPRRLRPDRQQPGGGPFRADLPHPGLTGLEADGAAARQTRRVVISVWERAKVQASP
jgi:hypothetical protein